MKLLFKILLSLTFIFSASANNDTLVFEEALQSYEKAHNAFFKDDLEAAKKEAKAILNSLSKLEGEKVKKTLAFTQKKLEALQSESQLEEAHKAFNVISQGLLVVLEKQIPVKKYARYYCPMVKKYWIQNTSESEKVMNPYAAKSMPHCGAKVN
jgi:hypothetical protein